MRHVVWDWNGTLWSDGDAVLAALNDTLAPIGVPPVTAADYRAAYTRPVKRFYERLLGRSIERDEWLQMDHRFHDAYRVRRAEARLAPDALTALRRVAAGRCTQSLLSMYRHEDLVPLVHDLGIEGHFIRIDGHQNGPAGAHKHPYLEEHLLAVSHAAGDDPSQVLMIGDALDDARAADHVGARCILLDGGSHPVEELVATGLPVASSLMEALDVAGL